MPGDSGDFPIFRCREAVVPPADFGISYSRSPRVDPLNWRGNWRFWCAAASGVLWAVLITTSARGGEPSAAINEMCPVMTDEPADPGITTVYEGRTVAFCCGRCLEKFLASPQRYAHWLPPVTAVVAVPAVEGSSAQVAGHAHDSAAQPGELDRTPLFGRLHPMIVHFPLAGIPLAFMGFVAAVATRRESFARADVVPLMVGAGAAVMAVLTGNVVHEATNFGENLARVAERHQFASTASMVLALLLVALRIWQWRSFTSAWRWVYGGVLLVEVVLLTITGYLGASLVYGSGHLTW